MRREKFFLLFPTSFQQPEHAPFHVSLSLSQELFFTFISFNPFPLPFPLLVLVSEMTGFLSSPIIILPSSTTPALSQKIHPHAPSTPEYGS